MSTATLQRKPERLGRHLPRGGIHHAAEADVIGATLDIALATAARYIATAVAIVTDFVFADDMRLHWSMATVSAIGGSLAVLLLILAARPFRQRVAELGAA